MKPAGKREGGPAAEHRARLSARGLGRRLAGLRPPDGNTGGKNSTVRWDSRTVTVHWLRVVHPAAELARVRNVLCRWFGEAGERSGRWFYAEAVGWDCGALLLWGSTRGSEDVGTCCVDVPGGALDALDAEDRFALCRELSMGGRVTRVDLAVDVRRDDGVGLIDAVLAGCEAGQLCGARVWEPRVRYCAGEVEAYGVCIGRRGKEGSGRYVRVYDKGLESGSAPMGTWERFEVEFTDDCAAEVAASVFGGGDWERAAFDRVAGAVSFREVTGQTELARRPLVGWWVAWCRAWTPISTVASRQETTLERFTGWLCSTVLPTIRRFALEGGGDVANVLRELVGDESAVRPRAVEGAMRWMLSEWRARERFDVVPA